MNPSCLSLVAIIAAAAWSAPAHTAENYKIERTLRFEPGNAQMSRQLLKVPAISELVGTGYQISVDDLDDDKYPEVIVLASSSDFCGSGGCEMVVLKNIGPGKFETLADFYITPATIGVTREKRNGYHMLASVDESGRVAIADRPGSPMHGKPLVYELKGASATPSGLSAAVVPAAAASGARNEMLGLRLGMTLPESKAVIAGISPPLKPAGSEIRLRLGGLDDLVYVPSYHVSGHPTPNSARSVTLQFSTPPGVSGIVAMSQVVSYDASNAPTLDNTRKALQEKYGAPHQVTPIAQMGDKLFWAWTPQGAPLPAAKLKRCELMGQSLAASGTGPIVQSLQSAEQFVSAQADSGCGLFVYADYQVNGGLVKILNVVVADIAATHAAMTNTARVVRAAAEADQSRALDEAKNRKPGL